MSDRNNDGSQPAGVWIALALALLSLAVGKGVADYTWWWALGLSLAVMLGVGLLSWVISQRLWNAIGALGASLIIVLGLAAIVVIPFVICANDRCVELELAVRPDPAEVAVGQSSILRVTLNGAIPPGDWQCIWYVDGRREREGRCDAPPSYAADRAVSPELPGDMKTVTVVVDMRDGDGRLRGRPEARVDAVSPEFTMTASSDQAHVGDEIVLEVMRRDGGSLNPETYECEWISPESSDTSCKATFEPAADAGREDYDYVAEAQVLTKDRVRVGPPVTITIRVLHTDRTAMVVLDSSLRMSGGLLEAAVGDVGSWLDGLAPRPGTRVFVGVQVFGEDLPEEEECRNTRPLVDLYEESPDPAELKQRLAALQPGVQGAPLIAAFDAAVRALDLASQKQDERFYLLTITGGPDTCGGGSLADALADQKVVIENFAPADELLFEFRLAGVTVVVPFNFEQGSVEDLVTDVQEALAREPAGELNTVVFAALNRQMLRDIIGAALDLAVPEREDAACATLLDIAFEQRDVLLSEESGEPVDNGAFYLEAFCS